MGLCKVTFAVFVLVEVLLAEMMENVIVRWLKIKNILYLMVLDVSELIAKITAV
jgi:hypothetical protein